MSVLVRFTVPGIPQQQGSKRYVGKGISIEANKKLGPWRTDAMLAAYDAKPNRDSGPTFTGPVEVYVRFSFPRPRSHYGTGRNVGRIKDSAPQFHAVAPDLDKLQRALGDVLTQSQVIRDDCLIASWNAKKGYASEPSVYVEVYPIDEARP